MRPALRPLRGAKITGYSTPKEGSYAVRYDVFGEKRSVKYSIADDGTVQFRFVSQDGAKTETYMPRESEGSRSP